MTVCLPQVVYCLVGRVRGNQSQDNLLIRNQRTHSAAMSARGDGELCVCMLQRCVCVCACARVGRRGVEIGKGDSVFIT